MEKTLFAILLGGVLLNNYALQSYLGVSTMLGASRETVKAAVTGIAVTVVTVLSTLVIWPLQTFVLAPNGLEYLQTLVFVTVIVAVASLVGAAAKALCKKPLGVWFPLMALNSAVLGVSLTNAAEGFGFLQALVSALAAGLGFLLAMLVFCGVRSRIEEAYVPKAFRGLPVYLMAAAILSLALFAF